MNELKIEALYFMLQMVENYEPQTLTDLTNKNISIKLIESQIKAAA